MKKKMEEQRRQEEDEAVLKVEENAPSDKIIAKSPNAVKTPQRIKK